MTLQNIQIFKSGTHRTAKGQKIEFNDEDIENIASSYMAENHEAPKADLALAAHCHDYIPPKVLSRYGKGVIGYHPSILPDYKGKNAVEDAIENREAITGGSLYYLDEGLDTGDIILQDWCMIHPHDTPSALWRRSLAPMGLKLFERVLDDIKAGKPPPIKKQK